jgi:hypothetical protein
MHRFFGWFVVAGSLWAAGCGLHVESSLTPEEQQTETDGVRAFMRNVAHDVSQDGPAAWRRHFEDTPAFFMAVNGALAFQDSQSASEGIRNVAKTFKSIQLQWGDQIRVDPLTGRFAAVGTTYREMLTTSGGETVTSNGFFTAVAEKQNGQWQFRDAHWSVPAAVPSEAQPRSPGD